MVGWGVPLGVVGKVKSQSSYTGWKLNDSTKAGLIGVALIIFGYLFVSTENSLGVLIGIAMYVVGAVIILGGLITWIRRLLGGPFDQPLPTPRL